MVAVIIHIKVVIRLHTPMNKLSKLVRHETVTNGN